MEPLLMRYASFYEVLFIYGERPFFERSLITKKAGRINPTR